MTKSCGDAMAQSTALVTQPVTDCAEKITLRINITGFVQGVGYRPFVYRLANALGVAGDVINTSGQVSIVAQATRPVLELFAARLISQAPANAKPLLSSIDEISVENITGFVIKPSSANPDAAVHILPDLAVCDQCISELFDHTSRRYHYPFINCTQCGPRNSIINQLPYDRKSTTMQSFKLCAACDAEYHDETDRRFHAEPVACEQCGPELQYVDQQQRVTANQQALALAVRALQDGKIIAVKGLTGYHLMCDASSAETIARLRQKKNRPDKPLAILIEETKLDEYAELSPEEKTLLVSNSRPVVLLQPKKNAMLAQNLTPGLRRLGIMLPNNPLQYLLCHYFKKPLVATSANISGEPILTNEADVSERLKNVAEAYLHNNRDIVRAADDPVMVVNEYGVQLLRSGRGLVPNEITLPFKLAEPVLAVGGQTKNTIALAWENRMVVSAQNGELVNLQSYRLFEQAVNDLQKLYQVKAKKIICDRHTEYNSSLWAHQSGLPVVPVLHHSAHASSLALDYAAEKNWLVFAWDGVGLGNDGTLWGGETLSGQPGRWQRVVSFTAYKLLGAEKTSRQPWRVAASLCWQAGADFKMEHNDLDGIHQAWLQNINCPQSTAVGRLFSAAAVMLKLVINETYEGHGPALLEALAETADAEAIELPLAKDAAGLWRIDWQPLIQMLMDEKLSVAYRARCFHESLALVVVKVCRLFYSRHKPLTVGLVGGVFQNQLLVRLIHCQLKQDDINVVLPLTVPVNDSGLCAGQIAEYYYNE